MGFLTFVVVVAAYRIPDPRSQIRGPRSQVLRKGPGSCLWLPSLGSQVKGPSWRVPGHTFPVCPAD